MFLSSPTPLPTSHSPFSHHGAVPPIHQVWTPSGASFPDLSIGCMCHSGFGLELTCSVSSLPSPREEGVSPTDPPEALAPPLLTLHHRAQLPILRALTDIWTCNSCLLPAAPQEARKLHRVRPTPPPRCWSPQQVRRRYAQHTDFIKGTLCITVNHGG